MREDRPDLVPEDLRIYILTPAGVGRLDVPANVSPLTGREIEVKLQEMKSLGASIVFETGEFVDLIF